jgi:hypothetical protein
MLPLHPINELFPMMTGEELADLAESIKAIGLIDTIVLYKNGILLDGKCRLWACELAGVGPKFKTFEGDEDQCKRSIVSTSILRKHHGPSQKAMMAAIAATAQSDGYWERQVLSEARIFAQYPGLADAVLAGAMSLSQAHVMVRLVAIERALGLVEQPKTPKIGRRRPME